MTSNVCGRIIRGEGEVLCLTTHEDQTQVHLKAAKEPVITTCLKVN